MLSEHLKEADKRRLDIHPEFSVGAKRLEEAANRFSDAVLQTVNEDVTAVYNAERKIETEIRNIERLLATHATLTQQWATTLDKVTTSLKEMGDLNNWTESIAKLAEEIRDLAQKIPQN